MQQPATYFGGDLVRARASNGPTNVYQFGDNSRRISNPPPRPPGQEFVNQMQQRTSYLTNGSLLEESNRRSSSQLSNSQHPDVQTMLRRCNTLKKAPILQLYPEYILPELEAFSSCLTYMTPDDLRMGYHGFQELQEWLDQREREVHVFTWLLEGMEFAPLMPMQQIEALHSESVEHVEIYVFKKKMVQDPLIGRLRQQQLQRFQSRNSGAVRLAPASWEMPANWATLRVFSLEKEELASCKARLVAFKERHHLRNNGMSYLSTSETQRDGALVIWAGSMSPKRISELYLHHCESVVKGEPSIYTLKGTWRRKDEDLRWMEIGKPSALAKEHKVVLLMGATGSGKSTLINGMVNYILGVRWEDPFRYQIIRDERSDPTDWRGQYHSQTTAVTAYTIHHADGMAIDYSVTLVDTPGYGDEGGVGRDKEITGLISRFLQEERIVHEVHAVCLVMPSAMSRLTPTQSYVLQSIFSLFGQNVESNIRLLVTFADGLRPPVLEAVGAANIPGLKPVQSDDGSITQIPHHKFNNSALFATNRHIVKPGTDHKKSMDQAFWEMGLSNFKSFFVILSSMLPQSLQQTQEVIQLRTKLEHWPKEVSALLDKCANKITEIEKLKDDLSYVTEIIESNEKFNYTTEDVYEIPRQVPCSDGAYNCSRCQVTCFTGESIPANTKKKTNTWGTTSKCKSCKCSAKYHAIEDFEWKIKKWSIAETSLALKKLYEERAESKAPKDPMELVKFLLSTCNEDEKTIIPQLKAELQKGEALAKSLQTAALTIGSSPKEPVTQASLVDKVKSDLESEKGDLNGVKLKLLNQLLEEKPQERRPSQRKSLKDENAIVVDSTVTIQRSPSDAADAVSIDSKSKKNKNRWRSLWSSTDNVTRKKANK